MSKVIRVLVVDDSALVRKVLKEIISSAPDMEVIATARDPYEARDILVKQAPDVITLDIEMPKMDGVTFLKKFMRVLPTPTIIISSLAEQGKRITIEALEAGAVDIITKPKIGVSDFLEDAIEDIHHRIRAAARAKVSVKTAPESTPQVEYSSTQLEETTDRVIAIGASTGGVEALARILPMFPPASPGIVIVQHMPEGFTTSFAKRLDNLCQIKVREARDNDRVMPGTALLAPGGEKHMTVERIGGEYRTKLIEGEKVSFNRPAVDVLFESLAKYVRGNCACALMTGMGKDGAKGLLSIRKAGGRTFIQDEATCVVYGMPAEAEQLGAAESALPLLEIPQMLLHATTS